MTSNFVTVQTKLWLDIGNDKHFPLCNSGGSIMSGLEVIEGGPEASPKRSQEAPETRVCYVKKASIEF